MDSGNLTKKTVRLEAGWVEPAHRPVVVSCYRAVEPRWVIVICAHEPLEFQAVTSPFSGKSSAKPAKQRVGTEASSEVNFEKTGEKL